MNMAAGIVEQDGFVREGGRSAPARRRRLVIAAAVAIVVALAAAWFAFRAGRAAPAPAGKALQHVTVLVPGRKPVVAVVTATGTLAAKREMPVGVAGEGGMIAQVLVEPGDWVAAGQTLAVIDRSVQAQQTGQMVASTRMAEADARMAQSELDRAQKLVSRGFVSQADIERKTAARDSAVAKVGMTRAQTAEMNARMGRLLIRAPAAGLVLARNVEPGQIVSSGTGMLFRLAKGGEMELRANVAEQDLARLALGRPAEVTPVGAQHSFRGSVWQLAPIIDPATRQGVVRIQLGYDSAIRPGGFAQARITGGTVAAPLVPESAVLSDAKGSFVYVVGGNGVVRRVDVTVGDVSDDGIVVATGLSGGERVVQSAGAFLSPGDRVVAEVARAPRG